MKSLVLQVDDLGDECNNLGNQNETKEATNKTEGTVWQKISAFMDLELLKDPVYLNILFGISIFNVAESNFKMIVPFYLADLGQSKSETAFCLSMMAASDIAARLIVPPICDRAKISRRLLFMVSSVFCALMRSGRNIKEVKACKSLLSIDIFFFPLSSSGKRRLDSIRNDSHPERIFPGSNHHQLPPGHTGILW